LQSIMIIPIIAFIIVIVIHEFAHGYVAYLLGDPTAKDAGRLTLNPLAHADPVGTILLPALLLLARSPVVFGWAKPVPINPYNFKNRKKGILITSLAGPMANFVLAAFAAFILKSGFFPVDNYFGRLLVYIVLISILLGLFNLLPIPPLDGSGVLFSILPNEVIKKLYWLRKYGFVILIGVLYLGLLNRVIVPLAYRIMHFLIA